MKTLSEIEIIEVIANYKPDTLLLIIPRMLGKSDIGSKEVRGN